MHGSAVAVGTDCAMRIITSPVPHSGDAEIGRSAGVNIP